jgi:hypothetical protein
MATDGVGWPLMIDDELGWWCSTSQTASAEVPACAHHGASLPCATSQTASAEAQQQQVQAQLGVLRRKLEQKEQLEDAIEGKHSKLTEVQPCVPDSH